MILSPSVESHCGLPREFNIEMTNEESNNTYIFTEKDLPGFKSKGRGANRTGPAGGIGKGSHQNAGSKPMERERSGGQPRWEKGKRGQTYYKRAIPSMFSSDCYVLPSIRPLTRSQRTNRSSRRCQA